MKCKKVKLKKGYVWECYKEGPADPRTGKRRQIRRRGKTQREAKDRVEDAINIIKMDGIDPHVSKKLPFSVVAKKWLDVYKSTGLKPGSVRVRKKEVKIINRYFGKTPIINITHSMYQDMLVHMSKAGNKGKPYSKNTILGVNTCANMIFEYAKRNKWIKDNPRDGATIPKKKITVEDLKENKIEETYFERDELKEFFNVLIKYGKEYDKEWFYTLVFTGMRSGELLALEKSDLNFENNTIWIGKTLYNESNNIRKYDILPTKTNVARIINVEKSIMVMLKRLIVKNDENKLKNRLLVDGFHDSDFVFQHTNGYPFMTQNIRQRMDRLMRLTTIKKHLTPHSFRHTHISMLTEAGVDLPTIMKRVGHVDPETTLKVYTHVTNKMQEKSVKNLSAKFNDLLTKITF